MKIQGKVILDDDDDHWVYNNIPNDIIGEILLRLPAKSLLRFRWACKYWFDLISRDSSFVMMQLHRSTITTNNNHHNYYYDKDEILMRSVSSSSIVLSIRERNGVDDSDKLLQRSLDYNDATGVVDLSSEVSIALPFDCPTAGCDLAIMGSCNGLILLVLCQDLNKKICIWNPCTKEYRILPPLLEGMYGLPPNLYYGLGSGAKRLFYGFGYDHTTDDYKVIIRNMYSIFNKGRYGPVLSQVQVYTLGTNSWRKVIDDGPNPGRRSMGYTTDGLFVNGAIYWINNKYGDIFSFDIGKEKFRHGLKVPNFTDLDHLWAVVSMSVFEGSLCVVINDDRDYHKEIWVMKQEYAVNTNNNESLWTKLSAIPHMDAYDFHLLPLDPLRFTRNGEILMVTDNDYLRLYDPKNSNVETICRICEYPDRCHSTDVYTDVYTESLVSLNSRTYMGRERMKQTKKKKKKKNQINKEQEHA